MLGGTLIRRSSGKRWSDAPWRALVPAAVVGLMLAFVPATASAHAELRTSDPVANAVVPDGPPAVELTFTEPLDPTSATLEVLDTARSAVEGIGEPTVDGDVLRAPLPPLEPGLYTVSYRVISAVDGHATAGFYSFLVDPSGTAPAPVEEAGSSSPSIDPPAVAARWIGLVGILVAFGSLVMWWHAGRPVLGEMMGGSAPRPPWLLIGLAGALAVVGLFAYLGLAARSIGETHGHATSFPLDPTAPFGWTPFAIAMRVALICSLLATAASAARHFVASPGSDRTWAGLVGLLLAVAMAGMSAAGHAAATGGPVAGAVDWVHLLAAAAWLGGLPAVGVLAGRGMRAGVRSRTVAWSMLRRHGRLALVAAPLVALSGIANSPLVLGSARDLVASSYGNLLLAKGVLLCVALGIGAANHLLLRGRGRGPVVMLVGTELVVAAVAILTAATMVTVQPASTRQPVLVSPPLNTAHLFGSAGSSDVHATVALPAPGNQRYQVTVTDAQTGLPPDDLQKVFMAFRPPPDAGLPVARIELEPDDALPGLYGMTGAHTPTAGDWQVEVVVRRAGILDESITFDLPVAAPVTPVLAPPPQTGMLVPAPLAVAWGWLPSGAPWLPALALLAGFAIVCGASTVARNRVPLLRPLRVALAALFVVAAVTAGSRALVIGADAVPPHEAARENPVPPSAESVAAGERLYLANCAACHGSSGAGDGPSAVLPRPRPLDEVLLGASDGTLSYRIANGLAATPMPPFAGLLTEEERWDLVNYLRDRWGAP